MNKRMTLSKQPNERASLGSACLEYLRTSKDIHRSTEKKCLSAYYVSGFVLGPWDFTFNRAVVLLP